MARSLFICGLGLIVAAATTRVLRDAGLIGLPPNVAPIAALALFSGAYLPRQMAVILPLCAMLLSDMIIGFYSPGVMASVYACFAITGLAGLWLRQHRSWPRVVGITLSCSTLFFLVTNAAVWFYGTSYPHTVNGLQAAYIAGLPFFRNTIAGDLAFVGLMFGAYELCYWLIASRGPVPEKA